MSSQKHHELMKNLDRCYDAVLLSSTKGITAAEISKEIGMHKTMVHRNLNTLELMGKVESQHGLWRVTGEQTKSSEKEITIELPMPKNQWQQVTLLEMMARECEDHQLPDIAEMYRIPLEKLKETRIIKIRGKNVDDLDLQRLGNLIQQANEKTSKFNLKRLIKNLKRSHPTEDG
jgi:DNA-binding MarR family transcriptional regulator